MGRGRGKLILFEELADLGCSTSEISRELDLLVSRRRDPGERSGKIRLHQIANGVELQANFIQLAPGRYSSAGGAGVKAREAKSSRANGSQKRATSL